MLAVKGSRARRPNRSPVGPARQSIVNIIVVALGLFAALQIGSRIGESINASTPWVCMAALIGPLVVVSAVFWLIGRLR